MFSSDGGRIRLTLDEVEADLLRRLLTEYLDLLSGEAPDDPVRRRLFPDASLEDPDLAEDFRSMTSGTLEEEKRKTVEVALGSVGGEGKILETLEDEALDSWPRLLTDLRLAIGVRLGVTEDDMGKPLDPRDPEHYPMAVLHYLGVLQESLVQSMTDEPG